jgi:predicted PurR-regulated permease PerM
LLAGLFDFVPVLGFILASAPAVLLAATVSWERAIAVLALYVFYHFVENYFIGPRVYGNRLRLSDTAVVLAFAVGLALGGIVGALVALPFAAVYPAVERIWLRRSLGEETIEEHARVEAGVEA